MLTTYRRHKKNCEHKSEGRKYRRCKCPIWVDGFIAGQEIRKSLELANWEKAQEIIRDWEAVGKVETEPDDVTVQHATDEFTADAEARRLKEKTVYKYKLLFRHLIAFCSLRGIRFVKELDLESLRKFRSSWGESNLAALKKLERLRSFFKFAQSNGWVAENLASRIANPKVTMRPTLPFSQAEMLQILDQTVKHIAKIQGHGRANAQRLRALVLLLRYSGLRIGDAVGCSLDRFATGKLRLYTQKTGTHVHCPLPDFVVDELEAIPKASPRFWFWSGNGKLQTAIADWQGRLKELFDDAKVEGGHAHRFRDTFATELLLAGVPLDRVSILLGHQSVKITERHYSPWIRERQEQAEADVKRTWTHDPIALLESKGTQEVHRNGQAPN